MMREPPGILPRPNVPTCPLAVRQSLILSHSYVCSVFTALYLFLSPGLIPTAGAQNMQVPLPDSPLVDRYLRRAALGEGVVPPGSSVNRMGRMGNLSPAGVPGTWPGALGDLWEIPRTSTPMRFHLEAGVQYYPPALSNGYRELRFSQELPVITMRGVAAGERWHVEVGIEMWERWSVVKRDLWNLPRHTDDLSTRIFRRALLGVTVGPFVVELGRFGRDWSVGRSGGLILGGEVRYFEGVAAEAAGDKWTLELFYSPLEPGLTNAERAVIPTLGQEAFSDDEKAVYMHRLTWRPRPNLRVGASEAAVFYGRRPTLADLTPVLLQHDRFQEYDNLMSGFDLLWYLRPGIGVYAELAIDDLVSPQEKNNPDPSSLGMLGGVEAVLGPWESFIEVVQTTDRLYHFSHPLGRWESRLRHGTMTSAWIPDFDQPIGHWIGPDAFGVFMGVYRTLAAGTRASSVSGEGRGSRGITPAPAPTIGVLASIREHRSLYAPPGSFPQPVELVNPDEAPPQSSATLSVLSLSLQWPLAGFGWLEGAVTGVHMESRPLATGAPGGNGSTDSGVEFRIGLILLLL